MYNHKIKISIRLSQLSKNNKTRKITRKYFDIKFDIKKLEKKVGIKISKNQNFIEFSPMQFQYLKEISKIINANNGGLLIKDYGYTNGLMKNTVQSVFRHNKTKILNHVGDSDITHLVNFKLIAKLANKLKLNFSFLFIFYSQNILFVSINNYQEK